MTDIEKVLMHRDGMTQSEAHAHYDSMREEFNAMIDEGCGYDEVEGYLLSEGFEMDYIYDLMF